MNSVLYMQYKMQEKYKVLSCTSTKCVEIETPLAARAHQLAPYVVWMWLWLSETTANSLLVDGAVPGGLQPKHICWPNRDDSPTASEWYCTLMNITWVMIFRLPYVYSSNFLHFSECVNFPLINAFIFKFLLAISSQIFLCEFWFTLYFDDPLQTFY